MIQRTQDVIKEPVSLQRPRGHEKHIPSPYTQTSLEKKRREEKETENTGHFI